MDGNIVDWTVQKRMAAYLSPFIIILDRQLLYKRPSDVQFRALSHLKDRPISSISTVHVGSDNIVDKNVPDEFCCKICSFATRLLTFVADKIFAKITIFAKILLKFVILDDQKMPDLNNFFFNILKSIQ